MNLYLVFAIALGAITGVVEAPVSQPVMSTLAARRDSRAHQRIVSPGFTVQVPKDRVLAKLQPRTEDRGPRMGESRPRAPALD